MIITSPPTAQAGWNQAITISPKADGQAPVFSPGMILTVDIARRVGANEFLVKINQVTYLAKTAGPLSPGDRLNVMVESLQPTLTIRVLQGQEATGQKLQQCLIPWRADPRRLLDIFTQAQALSRVEIPGELALLLKDAGLGNLLKFINSLIYSTQTKGNLLFLKEFIKNLGLTWEGILSREFSMGRFKTSLDRPLKSSLLALSREVGILLGKPDLSSATQLLLKNIEQFLNSSLKTIETLQAVNIFSWEEQNKYILQFPFLLGSEVRLNDLFVSREPSGKEGESADRWQLFLYLDFDLLGELGVRIESTEGNLDCIFLSSRKEVVDYIASSLPNLTDQLVSLGYRPTSMASRWEANLKATRQEIFNSYKINHLELVDTFA